MANYLISCDATYEHFYKLMLQRLEEKSDILDIGISKGKFCGRYYCKITCDEIIFDSIKTLIKDIFYDILLINYKYLYFRNNLKMEISDKALESLFFSSITLYDREYDEDLLSIGKVCDKELAIDSIIRFCTVDLTKRWKTVTDILKENFSGGKDKEAILEFVKHIVYALPPKIREINVYKQDLCYHLIDENGRNIANFDTSCNYGEIASKLLFASPNKINFFDELDRESVVFFKNIFNDKVNFFVDK